MIESMIRDAFISLTAYEFLPLQVVDERGHDVFNVRFCIGIFALLCVRLVAIASLRFRWQRIFEGSISGSNSILTRGWW